MKQKFTLHTHNNEFEFDGRANAFDMINEAQNLGFEVIGVTNHMLVHHNLVKPTPYEPMFFDDYDKAFDVYKHHIEVLENLKDKFKIDIKIGFEADFFQDKDWRKSFEKHMKNLNVDYLIGTNHFIKNKDESFLCNIYHIKHYPPFSDDELHQYMVNHYENIIASIKSGYYSFIAHIDYCTIFNIGVDERYDEYKYKIIETLKEYNMPYEINTSGYDRIERPHPDIWMIEEANRQNIPVLISDDAHDPTQLGRYFDKVENLLNELNYTNRFRLDMLKKPVFK